MLMRNIDTWIGVPICFLLSILDRIILFLRLNNIKEKELPKKILFIKLAEMGAIILSYPLLHKIKKTYPDSEIFFLTFQKNKCIFEVLGGVVSSENILTISKRSIWTVVKDAFKIIRFLRKVKIDVVFDLEFFSRFTAILSYISGAPRRIGYSRYNFEGLYRGSLLTHNVRYNSLVHITESYFSMFQVMKERSSYSPALCEDIKTEDIILPRYVSQVDTNTIIEDMLSRYKVSSASRIVLMSPGEGLLPLREWPLESYVSLANKTLVAENTVVFIVGATEFSEKAEYMCASVKNARCVNLSGKTTLPELLTLFELSHLLVTNDCGLAHLASLTKIKQFVFFGPETPVIFGPLGDNNMIMYSGLSCSPCFSVFNHRNSACRDNKCLKMISVDEVYKLIGQA
jgi:ADP-heptose:LPS heptosyltransferase